MKFVGKREAPMTLAKQRKLLGNHLNFAASEAYKLLRTNLMFALPDNKECRVIGITSALRGEGKSTTSVNLAYTIAQTGERVLMIEADMRLPNVAQRLALRPTLGLSDLLAGLCTREEAIQESGMLDNLRIIAAGSTPPNPMELLGSEQMTQQLAELKKEFDFIIFDGLVCFRSLKTLEGLFGFRRLMQEHAREYAEALDHLVAGSEKLEERISQSPTVAAKLLKIQRQESPVVDMAPQELEYRVKRIAAYSSKINFAEDSRVMLVTNGNVNDFLRLLGDDVLVSPLTDARYLSRSKRRLDHEEPTE